MGTVTWPFEVTFAEVSMRNPHFQHHIRSAPIARGTPVHDKAVEANAVTGPERHQLAGGHLRPPSFAPWAATGLR